MKTTRWQQVTVKGVIVIEPNHLNGWFIQRPNSHVAQRRKTALWLFGMIFVGERAKPGNMASNCKPLNTNLFIELLYKINITCYHADIEKQTALFMWY